MDNHLPRFPKWIQNQLDKIKGKKPRHTLVTFGHLGDVKCYLNVTVGEAHRRYCKSYEHLTDEAKARIIPTFDDFTKQMVHFTFEDEFTVYDIEAPD